VGNVRLYQWHIPEVFDLFVLADSDREARIFAQQGARALPSLDNLNFKVVMDALSGPASFVVEPGQVITVPPR